MLQWFDASRKTAVLLVVMAVFLFACDKKEVKVEPVVLTGSTMGTTYSIKIAQVLEQIPLDRLQKEIDTRLQEINNLMSTYQSDSEISKFNRFKKTDWFEIALDHLIVIEEAQKISQLSEGAFDITVGALVELWGFGKKTQQEIVPEDGKIQELLNSVNYKKIRLQKNPPAISKLNPEITIDLSAIAKGFAVDQLALLLEKKGLINYLVEIGGEIRSKGRKDKNNPWFVAIEKPTVSQRTIQKIVILEDKSMATSGDYRNYFEKDGRRYSHTINPSTGRPITHHLASVSVVHESCMTADGLATALMALGPKKAFQLAKKQNLAAFFIVRVGDGFEERMTLGFEQLILNKKN